MAGPLVAHPLAFLTTLSQHSWLDKGSTGKVNVMLFLMYFVVKYKLSDADVLFFLSIIASIKV